MSQEKDARELLDGLEGVTPGPWFAFMHERDGELRDCFVQAPDVNGFAYKAEILGDDEYREESGGLIRKVADVRHIARCSPFNLRPILEDYLAAKEVLADKRRLARELDVAMHGEEGAAKQASLCDLIAPAQMLKARAEKAEAELARLREASERAYAAMRVAIELCQIEVELVLDEPKERQELRLAVFRALDIPLAHLGSAIRARRSSGAAE